MFEDPKVLAGLVGAFSGIVASLATYRIQQIRLKKEFATETSAENAIRQLLMLSRYPYRSFPMIRHHLGGFEPNELRQLLVRAGAVRFMARDGTEMWALREVVGEDFQRSNWKLADSPKNKVLETELFPGAFSDAEQY